MHCRHRNMQNLQTIPPMKTWMNCGGISQGLAESLNRPSCYYKLVTQVLLGNFNGDPNNRYFERTEHVLLSCIADAGICKTCKRYPSWKAEWIVEAWVNAWPSLWTALGRCVGQTVVWACEYVHVHADPLMSTLHLQKETGANVENRRIY